MFIECLDTVGEVWRVYKKMYKADRLRYTHKTDIQFGK